MRHLHVILITLAAALTMVFGRVVEAQPVIIAENGKAIDCSKEALAENPRDPSLKGIVEADYPYFRNLECVENGYFDGLFNLKLQAMKLPRNQMSHFEIEGNGQNAVVKARYDREGLLTSGTLVMRDAKVPCCIYRFCTDSEYKGWTLKSTEVLVKNFDRAQTEYKVTLAKGSKEKVLHFGTEGSNIALLNRR